jgi:hypothetical protein
MALAFAVDSLAFTGNARLRRTPFDAFIQIHIPQALLGVSIHVPRGATRTSSSTFGMDAKTRDQHSQRLTCRSTDLTMRQP